MLTNFDNNSNKKLLYQIQKEITDRIKALLLRHKNDYLGACFGATSAATSAGYCGGRNRRAAIEEQSCVLFSIAALLLWLFYCGAAVEEE